MLALKALDLKGEVILPSYTFSATGHAVVWNGLKPVFADINPKTFNIDPDDVERKITDKTSAILAVHIFGNPCDISRLEAIAQKHKLRLIFDSSHALGSRHAGKMIGGFGDIECFSLSGTKVITSAEGGIVTSNNSEIISKVDIGRNYGAGQDYDCQYIGLNGKMSEFHAAIALESLPLIDRFVKKRNELAGLYKKRLSEIPGVSFQSIDAKNISNFKDFGVIINKDVFGMDRDELIARLNLEGIFPKKYFFPLHRMKAYKNVKCQKKNLLNTEFVAKNIVCLPIYSHMKEDTLEKICYTFYRIKESMGKK
jgi:dTDP-4-amino-4,6-dideoxygalactose transaminase